MAMRVAGLERIARLPLRLAWQAAQIALKIFKKPMAYATLSLFGSKYPVA
jgi:hypothetical protein